MAKRKREEEGDSEDENPWTMDDLKLGDRQRDTLLLGSKDHQKNVSKWAKRFEEFRSDPTQPEFVRVADIGDDAACDFLKFLIGSGRSAPTSLQTYFSYLRN